MRKVRNYINVDNVTVVYTSIIVTSQLKPPDVSWVRHETTDSTWQWHAVVYARTGLKVNALVSWWQI